MPTTTLTQSNFSARRSARTTTGLGTEVTSFAALCIWNAEYQEHNGCYVYIYSD
jgi:hypothetical protein